MCYCIEDYDTYNERYNDYSSSMRSQYKVYYSDNPKNRYECK